MDIHDDWPAIRRIFGNSFSSSLHYAVSTVSEHGEPHVTPIGSLILGAPGHGVYFEEFPSRLPDNLERHPRLCVLAVNSGSWYWLKSLLRGRFAQPPAVRLYGTAGALREATDEEIALWQKRVKLVRFTKGHRLMWRNMRAVRDIRFDRVDSVRIGTMTEA